MADSGGQGENTGVSAHTHAVLTVAEMARADTAAMAGGVPGEKLMENAGRAVADAVRVGFRRGPVLVLCGPGNNGGDGFVAARLLHKSGWPVRVALMGPRKALKGDAAAHAALWSEDVATLTPENAAVLVAGASVVVDALFGAGLSRPLEGAVRAAVEAVAAAGRPVVAVDVPSGVDGDDGTVLGDLAMGAHLTVTFFRKKPAHLLLPGRALCGDVVVADIGIPDAVLGPIGPGTVENHPSLWAARLPRRRLHSHKYDFGHAVIVGGELMTGAGRLAARAALRVGAGLVSLVCPPAAFAVYAQASPSVIIAPLAGIDEFRAWLNDPRKNAVLIGPGAGLSETTRQQVEVALAADKATVLDADALTCFADRRRDLFRAIAGRCILTPHEGEFARLFPDLAGDKLARTRAAAKLSGAVVLLKGADTVIAAPDGRAAVNGNAPPHLATAGSGDVLAGLITGLLAQGLESFPAACAGAWLHGAAGTAAGRGLIAEDLPEALPEVFRHLPGI
jgi:ADP-dependent NAD(P)H-hydrate dehydratase / NAD(P)H-hydrate epimerase